MNENDKVILEDALDCINSLRGYADFKVTYDQYLLIARLENDIETVLKRNTVYVWSVPVHSSLYTIQHFRNAVDEGGFTDYDGFGRPAKKVDDVMRMSERIIRPSSYEREMPHDATHVVWFNK